MKKIQLCDYLGSNFLDLKNFLTGRFCPWLLVYVLGDHFSSVLNDESDLNPLLEPDLRTENPRNLSL